MSTLRRFYYFLNNLLTVHSNTSASQDGHAAAYDGVRICVFCGGWAFPFRIKEINLPSGFKVNWNEGNSVDWDDGLSPWFLKTVTPILMPAPIKKKSLMDSQDGVLEDDNDLEASDAGSEFSWTSAELRDVGRWGTK